MSRTVKHQYDGFYGRPKALEYPNGLTLKYSYNDYGYLEQTSNAASGYQYRRITAMDEAGHITGADLANRVMSESRSYYSEGTMASVEVDGPLGRIHAHYYDGYDDFMNLISERDGVTGLTKSYRYDTLNRLTEYQFSNTNPIFSATVNYAYDKVDNFLKKTDYSANNTTAYRYGGNASCAAGNNADPNAVCQLTKLNDTTVSFQYDKRGNLRVGDGLTMTYNAMDKPLSVSGRGATTSFVYGSDSMRAKQSRTVGSTTTTTYYVDKYYEADSDGSWRAYLDDIAVLSYTSQRGHLLQFTLKDRLGSATTMADQNGNIVSQRYFDPFGRTASTGGGHRTDIVNKNTLQSKLQDLDVTNKNRRGFTDHEHLNEQQLIHMNGRIYDYNLGRFMSVDPLIQSPTSTQSVNPYSYIMNNPLAGTDPTGYAACSSTGSHLKGQSGVFCSAIEYGSGDSGKKQTRSEPTKVSNGASLVQEKLPTNLQTCEVNGLADVTAESIQHINSVSNYLEPYKLPDYVVQMAEFCRGYPCGGSGEVVPSIFVDDLLGLGLKSVILMPMKAIATHADDATAVGMRLSGVTKKTDDFVDLASPQRRKHILDGDATGGGHRPGTGKPGKSEFPQGWSDDKIMHQISDIATDPNAVRRNGRGGRTIAEGTRDGIDIRVIQERNGDIVSGFPTNVPRNPK